MNNQKTLLQKPDFKGGTIYVKGSKTGILLIHGFTATTAEVRLLANAFIVRGMSVYAPLLPGHGTTAQDLNQKRYQDWTNCVQEAYKRLKQTCSTVIVGGESMGAVLSLYLAEQHKDIAALLIYSPAIHVARLKYAKIIKWFKPILKKDNNDDEEDSTWQGYTVCPLRAAYELEKLQSFVEKNLNHIEQPVLILQGLYDKTIDADSSSTIYKTIRSKNKEFHLMEQSGHVMLLDNEIEWIINKSANFLKDANIL